MSCTRSRIGPWHLLAQNSINPHKPQEPPQPIQASCNSRNSSPSHQFGSPKLDTCKMQINLEKAMCSAKTWSNFPGEVHSLYLMSGGTLSSETQPRADPSAPQGLCDPWHSHTDLGTLTSHTEQATGASDALLRAHVLSVTLPQALGPSTAIRRSQGQGRAG